MSDEKEFTIKATDLFWDEFVPNYNKLEKEFREKVNCNEEIIKYLNEQRITMTTSYGLKRYICENLVVEVNKDKNSYIVEVSENGILKRYELDDFNDENANLESYAEVVLGFSKKNKINDLRKGHILSWFKNGFQRKTLIEKLAFILEMKTKTVNIILNKFLGEMEYNFRVVEEVISFFCLENSLGYEDFKRILELYKNSDAIEENEYKDTEKIKAEVKFIKTEEEFIAYLIKNKKNFIKINQSIRKEFINLYEDVYEMVKILEGREINRDTIEGRMLEGIPKVSNNSGGYESILKNEKLKRFMDNFLNRDKVDKIYKNKRTPTRKDIISIYFYKFSLLVDGHEALFKNERFDEAKERSEQHRKNPSISMELFKEELDIFLLDLGMGAIYIPNRFDNLILLSACREKPYEFFSDLIESTFEDR